MLKEGREEGDLLVTPDLFHQSNISSHLYTQVTLSW